MIEDPGRCCAVTQVQTFKLCVRIFFGRKNRPCLRTELSKMGKHSDTKGLVGLGGQSLDL